RITTPEGTTDVLLTVRSSESKDFEGRRWYIVWTDNDTRIVGQKLTPQGEQLVRWRREARQFSDAILTMHNQGTSWGVYLLTRDPVERSRLQNDYDLNVRTWTGIYTATNLGRPKLGPGLPALALLSHPWVGSVGGMPGYQEFVTKIRSGAA